MPSTTKVKVGHKLDCDEYHLILKMRENIHRHSSITGDREIAITSQEIMHIGLCTKGCNQYHSVGNSSTGIVGSHSLASKYWVNLHTLASHPWEGASFDAKTMAEELFSCPYDYARITIANLVSWDAYIDQPYEWRHQHISALLQDPSFEVREAAAFCLAEATEIYASHQKLGKALLVPYGYNDPMRTQQELQKSFQYYKDNPPRFSQPRSHP